MGMGVACRLVAWLGLISLLGIIVTVEARPTQLGDTRSYFSLEEFMQKPKRGIHQYLGYRKMCESNPRNCQSRYLKRFSRLKKFEYYDVTDRLSSQSKFERLLSDLDNLTSKMITDSEQDNSLPRTLYHGTQQLSLTNRGKLWSPNSV